MLYSKNGSIPYPYTDGTEGWIEVPDKPEAPEGKEVVWWYPPGWVIRDPKPADEENVKWSWSQSTEEWVRHELTVEEIVLTDEPTEVYISETSGSTTTSNNDVLFGDSITLTSDSQG
jgi:hypothetical protein